jgi:nucleoside-diphosphate-sugar epimerase
MFRAARAGKSVPWLHDASQGHLFAYAEDVARIAVGLLKLESRPTFEVFNAGGYLLDGVSWAENLGKAAGKPGLRPSVNGGWSLKLMALVDPESAYLQHHIHLWEGAMLLNDRATREALPELEVTPLPEALQKTLSWFGEHP